MNDNVNEMFMNGIEPMNEKVFFAEFFSKTKRQKKIEKLEQKRSKGTMQSKLRFTNYYVEVFVFCLLQHLCYHFFCVV